MTRAKITPASQPRPSLTRRRRSSPSPGELAALRRPGRDLDERAVAGAYRDERLSLHDCAVRFGISERRVATALDRQGVPRRPVGRPPRHSPVSRSASG